MDANIRSSGRPPTSASSAEPWRPECMTLSLPSGRRGGRPLRGNAALGMRSLLGGSLLVGRRSLLGMRSLLGLSLVLATILGPPSALGQTLKRIVLDGLFEDWSTIPAAFTDPANDHGNSPIDLRRVWLANDDRFFYLRFETHRPLNLQHFDGALRIHFDTDRSPATGHPIGPIGSDFAILLPERRGAEQTSQAFEAAIIRHVDFSLTWEPTLTGECFEMRIARDARFPQSGKPIFPQRSFDLVISARGPQGEVQEWAPDGPTARTYTFAEGSLPPHHIIPIDKQDPAHVRLVSYNMLWGGIIRRPEYYNRILRALRPDVICFQEVGHSWRESDPPDVLVNAETVGARLDEILPLGDGQRWHLHSHRSSVIASRWPLTMRADDVPFATGVGQAMALVDLPDDRYPADLYVICAHYKCCGSLDSEEDRQRQIQSDGNVAWLRELREPGGQATLPPRTPFVICGDLNLVGGHQILDTLVTGNIIDEARFGPDSPPDWDDSPLCDLRPLHNSGPAAYTWRDDEAAFTPGRLDAIIYSDRVMRAAHSFILNTRDMAPEDLTRHNLHRDDGPKASDHLPLVLDFEILP